MIRLHVHHPIELHAVWKTGGAAAVAAALLFPMLARADTVSFADGQSIIGKLQGLSNGVLQFQSERFGPMILESGSFTELRADVPLLIVTRAGERFVGRDAKLDPGALTAQTTFGELQLAWTEVAELRPMPGPTADQVTPPHTPTPTSTLASSEETSVVQDEVSITFAVVGNQLSNFFDTSRTYLATMDVGYTRTISSRTAVSVSLPIFYEVGRVSGFTGDDSDSQFGIGDLSVSASRVLDTPEGWPALRVRLSGGLPTGQASGPNDNTLLGVSSGYWSAGAELTTNVVLGRGALVGGVGYTMSSPRDSTTASEIREINWAYGYALQIDSSWQLAASVTGSFVNQGGYLAEPTYLTLKASYATPNGLVLAPAFANGLNSDSQDFMIGLELSKAL